MDESYDLEKYAYDMQENYLALTIAKMLKTTNQSLIRRFYEILSDNPFIAEYEFVSIYVILYRYGRSALSIAAIIQCGQTLQNEYNDIQVTDLCMDIIRQIVVDNSYYDGEPLKYFKAVKDLQIDEQLTKLYMYAVKSHYDALNYIPCDKHTPELCMIAVRSFSCALQYVTPDNQTPELCRRAVFDCPSMIQSVPETMQTRELLNFAIANHEPNGTLLYCCYHHQTHALCLAVVEENGLELNYVKNETQEICEAAVRQNALALESVDPEFKTPKLCENACRQNGLALEFVPSEIKTFYLCEIACRQDGRALQFVPPEIKNDVLCEIAVLQNPKSIIWCSI